MDRVTAHARLRLLVSVLFALFFAMPALASTLQPTSSSAPDSVLMVRLPGHVLPALAKATLLPSKPDADAQPLTLTIVLKHDDQAGFTSYLKDLYDPHSKIFHHYLTQPEIADRFGPSQSDYDSMLAYLQGHGFTLVKGSANRLTLTVRGTRAAAERAFLVGIDDYKLGARTFYANDRDPSMPESLAARVIDITGMANFAEPRPTWDAIKNAFAPTVCTLAALSCVEVNQTRRNQVYQECLDDIKAAAAGNLLPLFSAQCVPTPPSPSTQLKPADVTPLKPSTPTGAGQTVGLLEFDSYVPSDVSNYLNLLGSTATISQVTEKNVNGGVAPGPAQSEVLLDIDAILSIAPGANVVVYDAPFSGRGSFQASFNQMVTDKVSIISNSWAYCEDQTTLADVQSIDSILQNAAAGGISVFNGAGDTGSTCLDGSPNTVAVPADSPNATAVGGSSLALGPGFTYAGETWWNGSISTPPSGQGGFGVSRFFPAATYQIPLSGTTSRSVPDVAINADPAQGVQICEASAGGCPSGALYGGTSVAAPIWAALTANLNEELGKNLGALNPTIYPLANTAAFHNGTSMGSDFAHVGLGSPNLNAIHVLLTHATVGTPDATQSQVAAFFTLPYPFAENVTGVPADGKTLGYVVVQLFDVNDNSVSGKTVTLAASGGSSSISPSSGVSDSNGEVVFTVTDLTPETSTFTATDSTDGVHISAAPTVAFVVPPATSASLAAFPTTVTADGKSLATLTVTTQDSLGRPTPGKVIALTQSSGKSVISGPNPMVTDNNGQLQLGASDTNSEIVTYSATDVTDGNLPIPNQPSVTFSNATNPGCASGTPVGAPGLTVSAFATGFIAQAFNYGDVNWGCNGAFPPAFDSSGNAYVTNFFEGNIYKFPSTGGVASPATLLTPTSLGKTLAQMVFDGGNLYAAQSTASPTNFNNGSVLQIDPSTGAVLRTVASGLTCTVALAVDPLSGDLFTDDNCSGAGSDNGAIWRISNLGTTPTVSIYATLPVTENGQISFASDGTMYVLGGFNGTPTLFTVSGTNGPTPPTVTTLSGPISPDSVVAQGTGTSGGAQFLVLDQTPTGAASPETTTFDLVPTPPTTASILTLNGSLGGLDVGPDGCLYGATGNAVFKLTNNLGACLYTSSMALPSLVLTPPAVSPNPAQGSPQTFVTSFHFATAPDGTPVELNVSGVNPQSIQSNTVGGIASFTYTGAHQGVDTLATSATLNGSPLTSNQSLVTWGPGTDVTYLTLNRSQTAGTPNQPARLAANLTNASVSPIVPIAGQPVTFNLGGAICSATTNAKGNAACLATPTGTGIVTLTANFRGTSLYNPSSDSKSFNVVQIVASPTPTLTPTATPTATLTPTTTPTPTATPTPALPGTGFSAPGATISASPGQQVSATFSALNATGAAETLSSVTVALSDPGVFSALALSANGQAATAGASPPLTDNTFTFAPPIALAAGASVTFTANATVAAHPAMAASNMRFASADLIRVASLTMTRNSTRLPFFGALMMLGLMLMAWPISRRNRLIGAAMLVMVLAMSQVGCNGGSGSSSPPPPPPATVSSTITVTAASVSGGSGATVGLPLTIATVTAPP